MAEKMSKLIIVSGGKEYELDGGGGGGKPEPNSVGTEQIVDDSIQSEDMSDDVRNRLTPKYDGHIGSRPGEDPSIQIATGDIVKILLLYDNVGTTSNPSYEYRAYDLIRRV